MIFLSQPTQSSARKVFQMSWVAIAAAIVPVLSGCNPGGSNGPSGQSQTLVITGSSTVAPLVNEIGKQFEQDNPDTRVDVQTGGSSRGIADARSGTADIGMVSRALTANESDLNGFPVALDGIAMIVHESNPIQELTPEQIQKVYRKQIQNWSDVGGNKGAITVVNKAEGRSTLEVFEAFFEFQPKDIKADVIIGDNQQGLKTVAANPQALGYVSIGAAQVEIARGEPIKMLPLNGIEPNLDNVKNSTYPLSRVLNVVTKGAPAPLAQEFINYATSSQVESLVSNQQLIPVNSES